MNNLTELYIKIKDFANSHNMVNEFFLARDENDLRNRDFNYRTLSIMPLEANISRDLNSPVYTLDFAVVILDKVIYEDEINNIGIIEENLFVIGQLQDYLIQDGYDVDFDNVDVMSMKEGDYTVSSAVCELQVVLARKPYKLDIDN
jgi:hypothetical protein